MYANRRLLIHNWPLHESLQRKDEDCIDLNKAFAFYLHVYALINSLQHSKIWGWGVGGKSN